jgi:hypothetical protein
MRISAVHRNNNSPVDVKLSSARTPRCHSTSDLYVLWTFQVVSFPSSVAIVVQFTCCTVTPRSPVPRFWDFQVYTYKPGNNPVASPREVSVGRVDFVDDRQSHLGGSDNQ